jgi:phytoene dehydrogenase-like protein|uniref:FAD-dependent oxidoreductase n=1 Tax=Candidatus Planktophila sp. TaxID=2175601 RepID=UPI00404A38EC
MANSSEVLIVGAGLAGINAAITLQAAGVDVQVVESSDRPGGRITSDLIDGFICDRGFQLINSKYPALVDLDVIKEIDFIAAPRVIEVSLGNDRHALGDPRVAPWTLLDRATGTMPEKIALLRFLTFTPKKNTSVEEALKIMGTTYIRVLRPFLHGVFLTELSNVDARYGQSIIKSFATGSPGVPRRGVAELPKALAARITSIRYGVQIDSIDNGVAHSSVGDFKAKKIIIATDATTATQLLGLSEVSRMAGCVTWYHAVDTNPSGSGRLVVDGQSRGPIINTVVISDISSDYAPAGRHLISTTTVLGATESDVRRHLSIMWGTSTHEWQLIAKYEIPAALPIQSVGRELTQSVKISDSLYVVGDHRAVPSQQGALFSGRLAAELILN